MPLTPPNQLGLAIGIALALLAGAMLVVRTRGTTPTFVAQMLCLLVIAGSLFSIFGHLLRAISLESDQFQNPMPLLSCAMLFVLAAGVMLIRPQAGVMRIIRDKGPTGSLARAGLILVLFVPLAIGLLCALGQRLGYFGATESVALQVYANAVAAFALLMTSIVALVRSEGERQERERAAALNAARYRAAEQAAHLGQQEAEAATASKAAFLANMSHEIRTPMNGVMGFAELLLNSRLSAKQRRCAEMILESAQTLLKLLNDILDVSKIEAGQLDIVAEPANVRRKIEQCLRLMQPLAEQKGLQLTADFESDFPEYILIDGLRLRQILLNLLGNAVKFTPHGSISVSLRSSQADDGARTFLITVADTGVGIEEDRMEAVFDTFEQADVSISRRYGGSGLGLSISGRLCKLMSGSIRLDSKKGEGTLVSIELPLDPTDPVSAVYEPGLNHNQICPVLPSRDRSVLLVEDIDINQELIGEMLTRLGCGVEVASNGAEALERVRRAAENGDGWDLILMDVQMPVMDGLTATRAIRALGGAAASTPIVALSAHAFAAEVQECRDAGMDDHIAKPVSFAVLATALTRWIGEAEGTQSSGDAGRKGLAQRFDDRCRDSAQRLKLLAEQMEQAEDGTHEPLLREARELAHMLAGTAGMFGHPKLGTLASEVELEMKRLVHSEDGFEMALVTVPLARLIEALSHHISAEPRPQAQKAQRARKAQKGEGSSRRAEPGGDRMLRASGAKAGAARY